MRRSIERRIDHIDDQVEFLNDRLDQIWVEAAEIGRVKERLEHERLNLLQDGEDNDHN